MYQDDFAKQQLLMAFFNTDFCQIKQLLSRRQLTIQECPVVLQGRVFLWQRHSQAAPWCWGLRQNWSLVDFAPQSLHVLWSRQMMTIHVFLEASSPR